jgi:hypothetical protein
VSKVTDLEPSIPLRELIKMLCVRPDMFVDQPDCFRNGANFIDGYACGRGGEDRREFISFMRWLGLRLSRQSGLSVKGEWWRHIETVSSEYGSAYAQLLELYEQFLKQYHRPA